MFKRVKPAKTTVLTDMVQFPHCDQRVLHAPGECEFCDEQPMWQYLRQAWGIAFTGYEPENKELPCPANYARGETVDYWPGNRAFVEDDDARS